ncbi:cell adhesion molecule CEACAM6-like [Lissotriton helveticus]
MAGQGPGADVVTARVGETATLPASVTTGILTFSWYRGTAVLPPQMILSYVVPGFGVTSGPQSTGRESGYPNGTLYIRDLRTSDTGNYTLNVILTSGTPTESHKQLRVYEPVTKPTVTSEPSQLLENWGPAVITCNNSKAATTILWSFNSTSALPGNIIHSPDNRTLSITKVSRGESGIYQCVAMNLVSRSASDPRTLTVAYGPEDVKIYPTGSQVLQVGGKLSLSCTAGSFPGPHYQWLLNGADLKRPGNTYTIEEVSSRDNGNYTCVAENTVTGLSVKASVFITVNGTDLPPTGSPCPTPDSCWQTTLGVACGVLLGAAIIVAVIVVHYERRLKQKDTNKDESMYQNPSVITNADTQYENTRKGRRGQSANQSSAADPAYMELKHGDRATYEQIKRP